VVLTQRAAIRFFGTERAMGRTLLFDNATSRTVTGILRDQPYNTQFGGDVFVRYPPLQAAAGQGAAKDGMSNLWTTMDVSSYVRLSPGVAPATIESQIPPVIMRHLSPAFISEVVSLVHGAAKDIFSARLVPLKDVHLTKYAHGGDLKPAGSRVTVYGFAAIALLLLLIAGFNFTNLATARATLRAREVALRKVCGASRKQLTVQFLTEAVLTTLMALAFAFALCEILLPVYGDFLGHTVAFDYLADWPFVLAMIAVAVATGLMGGIYPALVLSSFRPADALRSAAAASGGSGRLRTVLVVFQFAISIGLGIVAVVIFFQVRFANRLDLGFERDNIVVLNIAGTGRSPTTNEGMVRALAALPGVSAAAASDMVPASSNAPMNIARLPGGNGQLAVMTYSIAPEFAAVYGIRLAAGRFLSRDRGADLHRGSGISSGIESGRNILIDEHAAGALGFTPETAIGKTVDIIGGRMTVVGVVHNVLFAGAQAVQVAPTFYYESPQNYRNISVRVKAGMIPEALDGIDRVWLRYIPDKPPVRWFVDDNMNSLYADAERQAALMTVFVGLSVFIACLGLFGLAAFTVGRRTKEIGIRKIFGATTADIVRLLLWQFSIPVLIANLIAWPAAWGYLHGWLEGYAYRIALSPLYFVSAGIAALVIAWATVAVHAVHVAKANPIRSIRYE
jgi:putative ABC transport system permease protein